MAFLTYLLKSAVLLAVFYVFYRLLLHKETFYGLNRAILLGIGALSLGLPLCTLTFHKYVLLPPSVLTSLQVPVAADTVAEAAAPPLWPLVLLVAYGLGLLVKAGHTCVSVFSVWRLIRRGRRLPQPDGAVLVVTRRRVAPFSWMRYIVLSEADYAADDGAVHAILLHERAHIRKRHSWDLLLVDGLLALQWFNPAVWLLRLDLCALHEYEADAAVLRSGIDARQYQYLLLDKTVGGSVFALTDHFNQKTLKNRIAMMLSSKSSRKSAWKALYLVPFIGLALAANAKTVVEYQPIVIDMPATAVKPSLTVAGDTKSASKSVKVKTDADTQQIQVLVIPSESASIAVSKPGAKAVTKSASKSIQVKSGADSAEITVLTVRNGGKSAQMDLKSTDEMLVMKLNDTASIAVSLAAVKDTLNAILSAPSQFSNYLVSVVKESVDNLLDVITIENPSKQITLTTDGEEDAGLDVYIDGKKCDIKQLESISEIDNVNIDKSGNGYTLHITTKRKEKR